ncbi:hypothetical protein GCM10009541_56090 [Micromonospora gifhornensis]|uniref:DUF1266 domain-containing protein n=1 Tax=Micromonospora gifhornensis TaxID=84594 RepID=A0ABQ4IMM6_9ACTN|nr:hypothetical protein Vgi01_58430 [Micromonospora gifhornensis]
MKGQRVGGIVHAVGVHTPEANEALRWLAEQGVTPLGPGRWRQSLPSGDLEHSDNDLAHGRTTAMLDEDRLAPGERLRLGLGLLDLLDEYWVTVELRHFIADQADAGISEAFWAGYRQRLEAPDASEQLQYSLWVDWFEDQNTAGVAFAALLGDDVRYLRAGLGLSALATGPLHRRAARILACSGPVRWAYKHDVYEAVAAVTELHPALFKGLLTSYHDFYGDLEPAAALTLLNRLDLPPETEHFATLRAVLKAGARNHYQHPELWDAPSHG